MTFKISSYQSQPLSRRLFLSSDLVHSSKSIKVQSFVDCGADASFIAQVMVEKLGCSTIPLEQNIQLIMADSSTTSTLITHKTAPMQLKIGNHVELVSFYIAQLPYDLILGYDWLERHNPDIDWVKREVLFNFEYCRESCLPDGGSTFKDFEKKSDPKPQDEIQLKSCLKSSSVPESSPKKKVQFEHFLFERSSTNPPLAHSCTLFGGVVPQIQSICSVLTVKETVALIQSKDEHEIISGFISVDDLDNVNFMSIDQISSDVYPFVFPLDSNNEVKLPEEISDYADVFSKENADKLPEHRPWDCKIDLIPGEYPPVGRCYSLTREEDEALKEWLQENINKGFIRESTSPFGAPCFFVRKPDWQNDKKLRLCMDYRGLNKITVKDRHPIPLISDTLRNVSKGKIFTTFDLRGAYNLLRMMEGEEYKTAFITKYGLFEFLVMPFGLCNAPAQFQRMMNSIFMDLLNNFVAAYFDDLVVYSETIEEHWIHVRHVLQILRENGLYCKLEKCQFAQEKIKYLGYEVSKDGISMDPRKIEAVLDWPVPKNVNELQMFLGFTNYYRRLIRDYATKAAPLTNMLKKDVEFDWSDEIQREFECLKKEFVKDSVLAHPDENKPFVVETDASDYGIGGVLSHYDNYHRLQPVAFYSRQMTSAERNYEIHDKELLAIIQCFEEWRHFLLGGKHQVTVLSDHNSLKYFLNNVKLSRRQARWASFISEFDFVISYRPGSLNKRADVLSRRPDYEVDLDLENQFTLLRPEHFVDVSSLTCEFHYEPRIMSVSAIQSDVLNMEIDPVKDWPLIIEHFLCTDKWIEGLPEEVLRKCKFEEQNFTIKDGRLMRIGSDNITTTPYLQSSKREFNIKRFHDGLGHMKYGSISDLIKRRYWWPKMETEIKGYIASCPQCQLDQSQTAGTSIPIRPLPPVAQPFERWGIDGLENLPETKSGNRNVITAIDYATRKTVAKAVKVLDAAAVAEFLYFEILLQYGAPFEIISDRGSAFMAEVLQEYLKLQGTRHFATTPYHPRTNGMVERMHASLNHAITTLTDSTSTRWDEFLQQAIFGLNVRTHSVTKHSPFYLCYGVHPRIPGDTTPPVSSLKPLDELEEIEATGDLLVRDFEELGMARRAAYERSKTQAELMRKKHNLDPEAAEYFFKVGDWVKMKDHQSQKFEFEWKGPFVVVDVGFPGTYWLMRPDGKRFDSTVSQMELAPWLSSVRDNESYFYRGHSSRRGNTVMDDSREDQGQP